MQYTKITSKKHYNWLVITAIIAALVIGLGLFWWYQNEHRSAKIPSDSGTATANQDVPGSNQGGNTTTGSGASKDTDSNAPGSSLGPSIKPANPTGQFVSNHTPNLSGSPAPNTETSTCTTTPGAYCKIRFAMNGTIKSLSLQKTDANGDVVWTNWSLADVGLTKGSWTVTAIAVNGVNAASTPDATNLVVEP